MAVERKSSRLFITVGIYTLLIVFALITVIPFFYLVCSAFKTKEAFFTSYFLPRGSGFLGIDWNGFTLHHFMALFTSPDLRFGRSLLNSVFFASVMSCLATLFCAMGGYALAKFSFKGNKIITSLVFASLIVPGSLLLAPGYQLVYKLGMLDSFSGLIIPGLVPAFGIFLFRQTMVNSIPIDLMEAARIDGCGEIRLFFTIVLPLIKPMMGAFMLITFLGAWNNFIGPQIILQTPDRFTLAVSIAQLKGLYGTDYGLLMAGTLVSVFPVMALFMLLQKDFISGLTAGAVKG